MRFAVHLWKRNIITDREFAELVAACIEREPFLGELAVRNRFLTAGQLATILDQQDRHSGESFGKIALERGFMDSERLLGLLDAQRNSTPSTKQLLVELGILTATEAAVEFSRFQRGGNGRLRVSSIG